MKNKYGYIGISLIILVFGIWVLKEMRLRKEPSEVGLQKFEAIPNFSFTDSKSKIITKKDMQGKVFILKFFFTSCPNICPKMIKNARLLENKFFSHPNFEIISITIDPKNDTPEILKNYAQKRGISQEKWHFLTGNEEIIYDFANKGFRLYAAKNEKVEGGFQHSGLFALIDKKGYIRSRTIQQANNQIPLKYYDGLDLKHIQMLKEDIAKLLKE